MLLWIILEYVDCPLWSENLIVDYNLFTSVILAQSSRRWRRHSPPHYEWMWLCIEYRPGQWHVDVEVARKSRISLHRLWLNWDVSVQLTLHNRTSLRGAQAENLVVKFRVWKENGHLRFTYWHWIKLQGVHLTMTLVMPEDRQPRVRNLVGKM